MHTHSQRLERWLGREQVAALSVATRDWYGPPIALASVPGKVYAARGGDFVGTIRGGSFASMMDRIDERTRRAARRSLNQPSMGFASLHALIAAQTAGKGRVYMFAKTGVTGVVGGTMSLHKLGPQPVAGTAGSAAPGGVAPVDSDTGGMLFTNPTAPDTQHITTGSPAASVISNTLLLYDRLFAVAKTMNSTGTEAVTGVPTRYQSVTGGAADSAEGNFLFVETGLTLLAATAHNWTVCTYTDQSGNASATLPSLTGNSGNIAHRVDHPLMQWFAPLASGDTGIKVLTQMQCSALVATGTTDFVIGHPLAFMSFPVANMTCIYDGIGSAFNLDRVFDDAYLAFLEVNKPTTTATSYNGYFETCAGS